MWGGKSRGSSLQEGVSDTYTLIDWVRVEILSCKKKKKNNKFLNVLICSSGQLTIVTNLLSKF